MTYLDTTMQAPEELAALLSRNLTLNPGPAAQQQQAFQPQQQPAAAPAAGEPKITYSISQHYHHSAHLARPPAAHLATPQPAPARAASEPPQPESQAAQAVLAAHGVDASSLSRAQLELFKTVDDARKQRLVALWRLSPPTGGGDDDDNPALAWGRSTSLEHEEALARMRLELAGAMGAMSLDGTPVATPAAAAAAAAARWPQSYMEPYMSEGYGVAAERRAEYNPATDPVFRTTNAGMEWSGNGARESPAQAQEHLRQQQEMENTYGLLMAMRDSEMEL